MKNLRTNITLIYREHRSLLVAMIILMVLALALFLYSLLTLSPSSAVVKVGYGDIGSFQGTDFSEMQAAGGYRDGSWASMFGFTIFSLILGIMHNIIALKLFERRGADAAQAFVIMSMTLLFGGFLVLTRLLGEG